MIACENPSIPANAPAYSESNRIFDSTSPQFVSIRSVTGDETNPISFNTGSFILFSPANPVRCNDWLGEAHNVIYYLNRSSDFLVVTSPFESASQPVLTSFG